MLLPCNNYHVSKTLQTYMYSQVQNKRGMFTFFMIFADPHPLQLIFTPPPIY